MLGISHQMVLEGLSETLCYFQHTLYGALHSLRKLASSNRVPWLFLNKYGTRWFWGIHYTACKSSRTQLKKVINNIGLLFLIQKGILSLFVTFDQIVIPVITIIPAMENSITITTVLSVSVKRYPTVWYVLTVDGTRVVYIREWFIVVLKDSTFESLTLKIYNLFRY